MINNRKRITESLRSKLTEEETYDLIETLIGEDYPSDFDMDFFKTLKSFRSRIEYCEKNLNRISSGSSRIVYMIDNEKVLKLAKNEKGLAQNEVESDFSGDPMIDHIVAKVFDVDDNSLWVEMELARKLTKGEFKRITGFNWDDFSAAVINVGVEGSGKDGYKPRMDQSTLDEMWETPFTYQIFNFIGSYEFNYNDLSRMNSYGVVKRDGEDTVVIIDYGLTSNVYGTYYS